MPDGDRLDLPFGRGVRQTLRVTAAVLREPPLRIDLRLGRLRVMDQEDHVGNASGRDTREPRPELAERRTDGFRVRGLRRALASH